jgi:hypothetical protein
LVKTGISKKIDSDPDHKKEKLQTCAQLLKNLADEIEAPIITATQTSDVPFEVWNNPDKVIDRSYTEGDKTLVKPFSIPPKDTSSNLSIPKGIFTGFSVIVAASMRLSIIRCWKPPKTD